eukprot:7194318-Prymnesium_polylepis.1
MANLPAPQRLRRRGRAHLAQNGGGVASATAARLILATAAGWPQEHDRGRGDIAGARVQHAAGNGRAALLKGPLGVLRREEFAVGELHRKAEALDHLQPARAALVDPAAEVARVEPTVGIERRAAAAADNPPAR